MRAADPDVIEEWKWNTPVWSRSGIICTGEACRKVVKLTFAHGPALPDPMGLFNFSLAGNLRRAIDIHAGDMVEPAALTALLRAAVARNLAAAGQRGGPG